MKNRAINALIEMGVPANLAGFQYIVDIMVMYQDEEKRCARMMDVYNYIAIKRSSTTSRVERAIRYAFKTALESGDRFAVEKYLSFNNTTNGNLLYLLYLRLKQESEEKQCE